MRFALPHLLCIIYRLQVFILLLKLTARNHHGTKYTAYQSRARLSVEIVIAPYVTDGLEVNPDTWDPFDL